MRRPGSLLLGPKLFRSIFFIFGFCLIGAALLLSQELPSAASYVYVGSYFYQQSNESLAGFVVAQDGSAQPVPGSPYSEAGLSLVGHGEYLLATDGTNIVT